LRTKKALQLDSVLVNFDANVRVVSVTASNSPPRHEKTLISLG
jgi:hypothetical protein